MRDDVTNPAAKNAKNLILGVALVGTGVLFLINGLDFIAYLKWWIFVPALIALDGLIDILVSRRAKQIAKGCFNIIFAFWIYASMEHLWGWTFGTSWPIILIAVGVQSIVFGLLSLNKSSSES
ncbi:LiaF transmembrane domain-containing protein [Undibacterium sp. SXout11W]|uniref:LiaF transmembrane domain-containing protein n=1 Tax=Undibacterium sp. SXout11W TaxID=3413050 RepID=UPI003BF11B80